MDETSLAPHGGFEALKADLHALVHALLTLDPRTL